MKKLLLLLSVFLLWSSSIYAEKQGEISLRFSRQDANMRIVMEGDEQYIKNANVSAGLSVVKIDFPATPEFRRPKDFPFETILRDRVLTIQPKDAADVRVSRLSAPQRLVIDVRINQKAAQETTGRPDQKPEPQLPARIEKPASPPAAQKPQPPAVQHQEKAHKAKVFVIDAGHGGYDFGLHPQEIKEKDVTLSVAKELGAALSKGGLTASLTRKTDQLLPLTERINFANSKNPDIFISIHASASDRFNIYISRYDENALDAAVRQYSLFSRQIRVLDKSRSLAAALSGALKPAFNKDVVLGELPLAVLNSVGAPAVLIELPDMKSFSSDQKARTRLVDALIKGINAYDQ